MAAVGAARRSTPVAANTSIVSRTASSTGPYVRFVSAITPTPQSGSHSMREP